MRLLEGMNGNGWVGINGGFICFVTVSVIEEPNKASKKLTLVLSSPEIQLWNVYSSMNEDVHKEMNGDYKPHGVLIRKIDLSKTTSLEYHILIENQYLGIRTKNEYDLVRKNA